MNGDIIALVWMIYKHMNDILFNKCKLDVENVFGMTQLYFYA